MLTDPNSPAAQPIPRQPNAPGRRHVPSLEAMTVRCGVHPQTSSSAIGLVMLLKVDPRAPDWRYRELFALGAPPKR
jgi:hypothetical protein